MDGGDYEPNVRATPERIAASLLVGLWIVIVWREYGPRRAVGAGIFYMVVLTFVWIPDLMAKLEIQGRNRDAGALGPVSPKIYRWVAWLMILGLPAGWLLFFLIFRG
jgi:hypothetical protein